jgi:hypothetical protein
LNQEKEKYVATRNMKKKSASKDVKNMFQKERNCTSEAVTRTRKFVSKNGRNTFLIGMRER